jgi:hypothetical protein
MGSEVVVAYGMEPPRRQREFRSLSILPMKLCVL